MTSQSATYVVNVVVSTSGTGPQPAGFGIPMFLYEHALEAGRLAGPFTSAADVVTAGHASGSPPHLWAQALMSQQPRVSSFYIGRRDSGDASASAALDAVVAENPSSWYAAMQESRDDADILSFAAGLEALAFPKIGLVQSNAASLLAGDGPAYSVDHVTAAPPPADGDYTYTFTGFGLVSPVVVTVTVAASVPATDTALAAAAVTAFDTAAGGGGSLEGVLDPDSISSTLGVLNFAILDGLATGTVTTSPQTGTTMAVTLEDADVASRLFDLGYLRTALVYHPTDTEYLDGAWASRCLSFNLDVRKGIWAHKRVVGVAGTNLTDAQAAALRAVNANYFAPVVASSGVPIQAFTMQGWMSGGEAAAGRRIDVTTTLDWSAARSEEAIFGVLLTEPNGLDMSDAGMNKIASAIQQHFGRAVAAKHFTRFQVPEGEEREFLNTPAVIVPAFSSLTAAERTSRLMTFEAVAYLGPFIERVQYNVEIRS